MTVRITFLILLTFMMSTYAIADDVGIVEVRLIEEEKNTYSLEVDISPYLLNTIGTPILPDRCTFIGNPEKVTVGPMLVVRYRFRSGEIPLQSGDELLLFWQRSGIVLTVYWLDGSSQRAFFNRGLSGIHIPVSRLREINKTQLDLLLTGIDDSFAHLSSRWLLHVLLVIACGLLASPPRMAYLLLAFGAGQGISLMATDLGFAAIFPEGIPVLMGVVALIMFIAVIRDQLINSRFWPVFVILGLLHGLGYTGPDFEQQVVLSPQQLITSRFGYNLVIDIFHLFLGLMVWGMIVSVNKFQPLQRFRQAAIYFCGGLTIAAIMVFLPNILTLPSSAAQTSTPSLTQTNGVDATNRTASRPVAITDPVVGFITITPFEIRCEWLIRARDFKPLTELNDAGESLIPIDAQGAFKSDLLNRFANQTILKVDGRQMQASEVRSDFVTVASYGVSTRISPVEEPLDQAAIGLSLAYVLDQTPSDVSLSLSHYPESISSIPVAFTDPWGSMPHVLTAGNPRAGWKRRLAGFRRPVIKAVQIDPVTWPLVSLFAMLPAAGIFFLKRRKWGKNLGYSLILICALIALGTYPFVRIEMPLALTSNAPSGGELRTALSRLLMNIYRAFDYRTEGAIYDRLAISVTGDQLADIYLKHRSAMEIENRGGARASVDNVELLEIGDIQATEDGFEVYAGWTVSGSVNHFGHIHYRKNRYKALMHVVSREGMWKIYGIELVEEERVL